jgi:tripartite-type tricarboxylate transporter receptor subunit TctC
VLAVNVTLAPMKGLDPVKDFEPIMWIATAQDVMMVPPNSPFRSVKDLVDYAKAHPGELNYARSASGSSGHLAPRCSVILPASRSSTCRTPPTARPSPT